MIDEETYKKEIVRMWDSLRTDSENKGYYGCADVSCRKCPLHGIRCSKPINAFKMIEAVEKWAKENPQKHKISQLEYNIIKTYIDYGFACHFYKSTLMMSLLEKGYFKGATSKTNVKEYFKNCEVKENDDN